MNREEAIKYLSNEYLILDDIDPIFYKDEELCYLLIKKFGEYPHFILPQLSEKLKDNELIISSLLDNYGYGLVHASERLRDSEKIVKLSLKTPSSFMYASDRLKKDKNFVMSILFDSYFSYSYADDSIKVDEDIINRCIKLSYISILKDLPKSFFENESNLLEVLYKFEKVDKLRFFDLKSSKSLLDKVYEKVIQSYGSNINVSEKNKSIFDIMKMLEERTMKKQMQCNIKKTTLNKF
jgi:hypothetical protein